MATVGAANFTQTGGTVKVPGQITVFNGGGLGGPAVYNFNGGTLSAGTIFIGTNGTFQSNNTGLLSDTTDIELSGGHITGALSSVGTFNGNSGNILGAFENDGICNFKGDLTIGTFVNTGVATLTAGHTLNFSNVANGKQAIIGYGGILTVDGGTIAAADKDIALTSALLGGSVGVVQSSGTVQVRNLTIGSSQNFNFSGLPNYELDAGTLSGAQLKVADAEAGAFYQNGGVASFSGSVSVGVQTNSVGEYYLTAGTLNSLTDPNGVGFSVAPSGSGTVYQNGAVLNTGRIIVGGAGTGEWIMKAGTINCSGLYVNASSTALTDKFNQSGGAVNVSSSLFIGFGQFASSAFYNQSGGTLNVQGLEAVGQFSPATFTQTGGVHSVNNLVVGNFAAGTYNLSGGTLSSTFLQITNAGMLNQTGGYLNVANLTTSVGAASHYNFQGGVLATGSLVLADGGLIGGNFSTLPNRSVYISSGTQLDPFSVLTLNGGTFSTGSISGGGQVIFNSGTLISTNSSVSIGNGPFANPLVLGSGATLAVNSPFFAQVIANAVLNLSGGALIGGGGVFNNGQINLASSVSTISGGSLTNQGILTGTGRINSALNNAATGQINIGAADTMRFLGGGNTNAGRITLGGGTASFANDLTNNGTISGRGSLVTNNFINNGTVNFSQGATDVYGPISNAGTINITGQSVTSFYNNLNTTGGKISVGTNSTAVFFGAVTGSASFGGAGIKDFEGTLNGPAINSAIGDTYVGTTASVSTAFLTEDDVQISGAAAVVPNGSNTGVSRVHTLSFVDSGKLDLNDNKLIVDYTGASPLQAIRSNIITGRHGGDWLGNELTSALAHNASLSAHPTALGYAEASAVGMSTFGGQPVDPTSVLVRYTYVGDANLDGVVNALDFNALANNFGVTNNKFWSDGDFTFDGFANTQDFVALATNFNQAQASGALGSLVPEPGLLWIPALLFLSRRRKSGRKD